MNRLFATAFSALLAVAAPLASGAASPAATQSWVRKYVVTAQTDRVAIDVSPVTFSVVNDEGVAETVTLTFERADCGAMRVEDSHVPGMTNGTLFAENGEYAYANTANAACTGFSGAMEHVGWMMLGGHYEYTTNGTEIASNLVYIASNEVRELRFVLDVGGEVFASAQMKDGRHKCVSASDSSRCFYLRGCTVTERVKDDLLRPRAAFSVLGLLFPPAYAERLGEKAIYKSVRDGDYVYDYWRAHYYTDGEDAALSVKVGEITVTAGEQSKTFDLGDLWLLRIGEGVDFCDLGKEMLATEDDIYKAIKERLGPGRAVQIKNSSAWQDVAKKVKEATNLWGRIVNVQCPEEGYDEHFEPQYEPHECGDWKGMCGSWRCGRMSCTNVVASVDGDPDHPAQHEYYIVDGDEGNGMCAICIHCRHVPEDESLHDGWHNDVISRGPMAAGLNQCVCDCGKMWLPHVYKRRTDKYISAVTPGLTVLIADPYVCYEVWMCDRCANVVEDLVNEGGTITARGHNELHDGRYSAETVESPITGEDVEVCRCTYTCHHVEEGRDLGCGAVRTEDFDHAPDRSKAVVTGIVDAEYHRIAWPCVNGFVSWSEDFGDWRSANSNWCGYVVYSNEEHRCGVDVVMPWDDPDFGATRTHHKRVRKCGHWTMDGRTAADPDKHECGMLVATNELHAQSGKSYHYFNAGVHEISNFCNECKGTFLWSGDDFPDGREPHEPKYDNPKCDFVDRFNHTTSNFCARCEEWYRFGSGYEAHAEAQVAKDVAYVYFGPSFHDVSNRCDKCDEWYFKGAERHFPASSEPTRCVARLDFRHDEYNVCGGCTTNAAEEVSEGVTNVFVVSPEFLWRTNVDCSASVDSWELRDDVQSNDVAICRYGCGNTAEVQHNWTYSSTSHWCQNGRGHLSGQHEWAQYDVGEPCGVCGCPYYPPEPKCGHCNCKPETCDYWVEAGGRCGCAHCGAMAEGTDDGGVCSCELDSYAEGGLYYKLHHDSTGDWAEVRSFAEENHEAEGDVVITESISANGRRYPVRSVEDGDDSVRRDESVILSVSAPTNLTSVGVRAFGGHWRMTGASFPGATEIGERAFIGCESLTNVDLSAATSVGEFAFQYDHHIRSVNCPEMVTVGTNAFAYSWGIQEAHFPKATHFCPGAFETGGHLHLYIEEPSVTFEVSSVNFAAIHFPSNRTLNGVAYPAESVYVGDGYVPIIWEAPEE